MAHSLPYSIPYIAGPQPQYLLAPHPQHPHVPGAVHLVSAHMTAEQPQRTKRPKYTRSKAGCLTCRVKKIKCDEIKPNCQRCTKGQRDCRWPDPAPAKKKTPARKSSSAREHSPMADSASRVSESSSTSRDVTPNTRDLNGRVNTASVTESERYQGDAQAYSYAETGAPLSHRQTLCHSGSHNQLPHALTSSYQTSMTTSYSFNHSPSGSISSRSNSRPSTANSIPASRFSGSALEGGGHYDASPILSSLGDREYSRWETLPPPPRTESSSYSYHSPQESDVMTRQYPHEHGSRV